MDPNFQSTPPPQVLTQTLHPLVIKSLLGEEVFY